MVAYKGLSLAKSPLRPAGPRLWKRCSKPFFDDVDVDTEAYIHTEGGKLYIFDDFGAAATEKERKGEKKGEKKKKGEEGV